MCRMRVAIAALGVLTAAGCAHAPAATTTASATAAAPEPAAAPTPALRVTTAAYSHPIPPGFREVHVQAIEAIWQAGGSAIAETARPLPDGFLGSVVVTPVPPTQYDPTDENVCTATAQQLAQATAAVVQGAHVVDAPWGRSCQFVMQDSKNPNRIGVGMVAHSPKSMWVITCNLDARDDPGANACKAVIDGFAFNP